MMTAPVSAWPIEVKLLFYLMPMILVCAGLGLRLLMILGRDLGDMERIVSGNTRLASVARGHNSTLKSKWFFIAEFSALLTYKRLLIWGGRLVAEDLNCVPRNLRLRLSISTACLHIGFFWMMLLYVLKGISSGWI